MNPWHDFYQDIRDPQWPECVNEHEFTKLPQHIQQEILTLHQGHSKIQLTMNDLVSVFEHEDAEQPSVDQYDLQVPVANDFVVYYNSVLDGGGNDIGQRYPLILKLLYPNRIFDDCLDWCSGHGVIGFRLLADGVCNKLHLLEMYAPAVAACRKTIEHMPPRLANTVSLYETSSLASLPQDLQFDLIVANPPHFPLLLGTKLFDIPKQHGQRITVDREWKSHRDFFATAAKHLKPNGVILLQEIYHVDEFSEFIKQGGLKIRRMFAEKDRPVPWYLELCHQ